MPKKRNDLPAKNNIMFLTLFNKVQKHLCIRLVCLSVYPSSNSVKYPSNVFKLIYVISFTRALIPMVLIPYQYHELAVGSLNTQVLGKISGTGM